MTLSLDLPPLDPEVSSLFGATVEAEPPSEGVAPGALLDGTVETVDENWVYVRLTDDAVGRCPLDEAAAPGVRATPEVGAQVRALVEADLGEGRWGVSIGKAVLLDLYGELRRLGRAKERVRGRINQVVRGGFAVDALGVRCFLPGRESGIPRDAAFDAIGHAFTFDVIRFDRRRGQPVLSRARVAKIQRERALEHVWPRSRSAAWCRWSPPSSPTAFSSTSAFARASVTSLSSRSTTSTAPKRSSPSATRST